MVTVMSPPNPKCWAGAPPEEAEINSRKVSGATSWSATAVRQVQSKNTQVLDALNAGEVG